jgi:FkbM family methyltransferase
MSFVSYAQNFEDVLLWRALKHVDQGFYIDVGAQHPVVDSVSKAFYERGWRGIHVEPAAFYADLIRRDRPDELVVQAAMGNRRGLMPFFEIPGTGLSTGSREIAEHHRAGGYEVRETVATVLTLDDLFQRVEAPEIHWLKIDVEGFERQVLAGWRSSARRPWIVVVESTYPNEQRETHQAWERLLRSRAYVPVYADGLNRYYVADAHKALRRAFRYAPNVFDDFQLTEASQAVQGVRARLIETIEGVAREKQAIEAKLAESLAQVEARTRQLSERERAFAADLARMQHEARETLQKQAQAHTERERALRAEAAALRESLTRAREQAGERERVLSGLGRQTLERVERDARAHLKELVEREREFSRQVAQIQREGREALERQARERDLAEEAQLKLDGERDRAQARIEQLMRQERQLGDELLVQRYAHQATEERLAELERKIDAAKTLESDLRSEVAGYATRLAEVERELEATRGSLSWKLTSPLRRVTEMRRLSSLVGSEATERPLQPPSVEEIRHVDQLLRFEGVDFVEAVYRTLLQRSSDPVGLKYYVRRLRAGKSKAQIIVAIALSNEAKQRGVALPGLNELIAARPQPRRGWRRLFSRPARGEAGFEVPGVRASEPAATVASSATPKDKPPPSRGASDGGEHLSPRTRAILDRLLRMEAESAVKERDG